MKMVGSLTSIPSKQVGDVDHVNVSASVDAAEKWLEEIDSEGVAFE
jgi:hypothetical protein